MEYNLKYLLIVNPNSGARNHEKNLSKIIKYFKKFKTEVHVKYTEYQGHGAIIAHDSLDENYSAVIGCGGDGTINEVANGLAGTEIKLGIIPWGTGNVFAREMHFPKNLKKLCKVIIKEKYLKMDLGLSGNNKFFLLMASVGFDAYSLKQIKYSIIKKSFGIFAYFLGAIKAFFNYKFPELEVSFDDGCIEKGTFVLISNTSRYGKYFKITPFADPFDGFLDVIIYKEKGKLNFLKLLLSILWNTLTKKPKNNHYFFSKKNSFYRVKSLQIHSPSGNVHYQIDGDHFMNNDLNLSVSEKSLNVILPNKMIKKYLRKQTKNNLHPAHPE